jgi:hypothetical protein
MQPVNSEELPAAAPKPSTVRRALLRAMELETAPWPSRFLAPADRTDGQRMQVLAEFEFRVVAPRDYVFPPSLFNAPVRCPLEDVPL